VGGHGRKCGGCLAGVGGGFVVLVEWSGYGER